MATDTIPLAFASTTDFSGILKDEERYSTGQTDRASDRLNGWFDQLMIQAGLEIAPSVLLLLCVVGTIAVGGLVFVIQENLLTAAMAALLGFMLPIGGAMIARSRRQMKLMQQLPAMIDELARAARTGRSLDQCLELVAGETPAPLGSELQLGTRRMQMGMDVGSALTELPQRTGLVTMSVLVTALTVHQQTGGDLVTVLERLSRTIRDRLLFLGRLRAATVASRATAILMIALPPAIFAFFMFRDPDYFQDLMSSSWGKTATLLAVCLDILGSLWILRILKTSQRT